MNRKGILIVVSGFSGAGKGTLMKALLARYEEYYALSISEPHAGRGRGKQTEENIFSKQKKNLKK